MNTYLKKYYLYTKLHSLLTVLFLLFFVITGMCSTWLFYRQKFYFLVPMIFTILFYKLLSNLEKKEREFGENNLILPYKINISKKISYEDVLNIFENMPKCRESLRHLNMYYCNIKHEFSFRVYNYKSFSKEQFEKDNAILNKERKKVFKHKTNRRKNGDPHFKSTIHIFYTNDINEDLKYYINRNNHMHFINGFGSIYAVISKNEILIAPIHGHLEQSSAKSYKQIIKYFKKYFL